MNWGALISWLNHLKALGLVKYSNPLEYDLLGYGDYSCALQYRGKRYLFISRPGLSIRLELKDVPIEYTESLDEKVPELIHRIAGGD